MMQKDRSKSLLATIALGNGVKDRKAQCESLGGVF
jgi:hypothetical protein